jgi:carbon-monoxide dehydrogenase medium subunit
MHDFDYHRPASVEEAATLLAAAGDNKLLAGGMSLIPSLKLRLNRYSALVDLGALQDIRGIRRDGGALVIGAMTLHAVVAASAEVRNTLPALADLAEGIGDPLVRNRGTLGGSIANADPAADYPAGVVGLGATVITNRRTIAGDDFFTGVFETALQAGEIIKEVRFPVPQKAAYAKYRQPASRFAIVGVFVAKTASGVRVAVTGASAAVFRFADAEAALAKRFDPSALDGITINADNLNADIHASAEYRAHSVVEMTLRAVLAAR